MMSLTETKLKCQWESTSLEDKLFNNTHKQTLKKVKQSLKKGIEDKGVPPKSNAEQNL